MEIYGVYSITNCFTLLIIGIKHDIEDCVKVALYDGETYTRPTWCKVRYNAHGEDLKHYSCCAGTAPFYFNK